MADRAMLTLARLRRAERTRARSAAQTRSEAEDGEVRLICFAMQRRWFPWNLRDNPPVENNRAQPLQVHAARRSIALLKAGAAALPSGVVLA